MRNRRSLWLTLGISVVLGGCGGSFGGADRADGVTVDGDWSVIT